jgi:hypothetical protein
MILHYHYNHHRCTVARNRKKPSLINQQVYPQTLSKRPISEKTKTTVTVVAMARCLDSCFPHHWQLLLLHYQQQQQDGCCCCDSVYLVCNYFYYYEARTFFVAGIPRPVPKRPATLLLAAAPESSAAWVDDRLSERRDESCFSAAFFVCFPW